MYFIFSRSIDYMGSVEDVRSNEATSDEDDLVPSFGFIRDPFRERPEDIKKIMLKQTKRTQRYRSTAKSRICGMTVGDIRFCFQQLRSAGSTLSPHLILYNGQPAGAFALAYLIETSNSMRKRRKRKKETECSEGEIEVDRLPVSQLSVKPRHTPDVYTLQF
jgi:hypothetical protein